jgi:hypothetical protein
LVSSPARLAGCGEVFCPPCSRSEPKHTPADQKTNNVNKGPVGAAAPPIRKKWTPSIVMGHSIALHVSTKTKDTHHRVMVMVRVRVRVRVRAMKEPPPTINAPRQIPGNEPPCQASHRAKVRVKRLRLGLGLELGLRLGLGEG